MGAQVSFVFDGLHNQKPVVNFLRKNLKDLEYKIESISRRTYRIYVSSSEGEDRDVTSM